MTSWIASFGIVFQHRYVRENEHIGRLNADWWLVIQTPITVYALNNLTSHDFACRNWVIVSGHNDNRTLLIEEIKSNEGKKVPRPMPFNGTLSLLFLFLESHRHIHFDEINTRTLTSVLNIKKSKVYHLLRKHQTKILATEPTLNTTST